MQLGHFFKATLEHQCSELFADSSNVRFCFVDLESLAAAAYHDIGAMVLFAEELKRFKTFRISKRQIEFLGGRLAAKEAVKALLYSKNNLRKASPVIEAGRAGRPTIRNLPEIDVSISHSGTLAGALVGKQMTCGIDLQKITPQVLKIKERFVNYQEEMLLRKLPGKIKEEALYTLLWSVKEALRKAVPREPLLGFLEMELTEILPKEHSNAFVFRISTSVSGHLTEVTAFFHQRTAIACCFMAGC